MIRSNADQVRLRRMLAATTEVNEIVQRTPLDAMMVDRVACLAVERLLQKLADNAHGVGHNTRETCRGVPWDKLDSLRDTVSTAQDRIDTRVLYAIVTREGPRLQDSLRVVLPGDDE